MPYYDFYASPSYVPGAGVPAGMRNPPIQGISAPQGFDWSSLLPYAAGAGALGLGLLSGQRNQAMPSYGNSGYLPGTAQLNQGFQDIGRLISQLQASTPPSAGMQAVENASNRQNVLQGLSGPGAATNTSNAVANFTREWNTAKTAQLAQLLGLQADIGGQLQAGEERRRTAQAQSVQGQNQAAQEQRARLFQLLGLLVGGAFGGPVGAGIGAGLGGLAEQGLGATGIWGPSY